MVDEILPETPTKKKNKLLNYTHSLSVRLQITFPPQSIMSDRCFHQTVESSSSFLSFVLLWSEEKVTEQGANEPRGMPISTAHVQSTQPWLPIISTP